MATQKELRNESNTFAAVFYTLPARFPIYSRFGGDQEELLVDPFQRGGPLRAMSHTATSILEEIKVISTVSVMPWSNIYTCIEKFGRTKKISLERRCDTKNICKWLS